MVEKKKKSRVALAWWAGQGGGRREVGGEVTDKAEPHRPWESL